MWAAMRMGTSQTILLWQKRRRRKNTSMKDRNHRRQKFDRTKDQERTGSEYNRRDQSKKPILPTRTGWEVWPLGWNPSGHPAR